jgi:predicted kinase
LEVVVLEVVVLVGLQASGKTTFYRRHLGAYVHVSKDNWPNARRRTERQLRAIHNALAAGCCVAVDNTNPTIEDRYPLVEAARAHHASAVALFFPASVRECLVRNAQREGRARVPDVAIFATAKRLQPPILEEGFQRLYQVHLTREGLFIADQLNCPRIG